MLKEYVWYLPDQVVIRYFNSLFSIKDNCSDAIIELITPSEG